MKVLIIFIFLLQHSVFAGFEQTNLGSRANAIGGAFVGLSDDCWSIFYNPAGLSLINFNEAAVYYSPRPFGLSELSTTAFAANYSTKIGTLAFAAKKYGFDLYKEISGTLSYANLFLGINIGTSFHIHTLTIKGYGNDYTIGVDIGIMFPLAYNLLFGFSAKNINAPTIGKMKEKLPQVFSFGTSYSPINNLFLLMDYEKEIMFDGSLKAGFEYWIFEFAALRLGVNEKPSTISGGLGLKYSSMKIDYAIISHQELELTHSITIGFLWGERK
ncbi:MAG: hypothetical protein Q8K98_00415 [Bacteroidota bacterium]|nr:hypothetical protein [Bacteroidota bacterium]